MDLRTAYEAGMIQREDRDEHLAYADEKKVASCTALTSGISADYTRKP